jgi:hypothetical protein
MQRARRNHPKRRASGLFQHGTRPRTTMGRPDGDTSLAKPNYSFEKRQRELAKKKQQEEKDARKREERDAAKAASDDLGKTTPGS